MEAAAAIWGICQLHVLNNPQDRCPRRLRRVAAAGRRPPVPGHARQPVRGGLRRNHLRRKLAGRRPSRTADQACTSPNCCRNWPSARPQRATPRSGLPVHPRRRRAAQRHQQYRRARHRLAPPRARGTLRISPQDAEALGCADGEVLRVVTRRGDVEAEVEISDMMQPGNISLPNGQGLDYRNAEGEVVRRGVAPNEVTDCTQRDFPSPARPGKYVPARLERLATPAATNA
ncbi:molybdopterin dinucleotide binding domain-containing protein [Pseudomonas aeruginosa]